MFLKAIKLKNFRGYKSEVVIPFDNLTAFIGKNDIGKSTVLEALEIFFNGEAIKIEKEDLNIGCNECEILIGCIFSNLPDQITLDSTPTIPAKEHFLNAEGDLEIHKVFDCSLKKLKETVFVYASHPTVKDADDLLILKNADLKGRLKKLNISEGNIDLRVNSSIRNAIWSSFSDLQLKELRIPIDKEDAKKIWEALSKELPTFALFQSDRTNNDQDKEAQDPLKLAVIEALKLVEPQLEEIRKQVKEKATEVAVRTLGKLQEMAPEIAKELKPDFKSDPKWDSLFKLSFTSDDEIPLNKRGSGVRRLILLNFFRAEAERKRHEKNAPSVIYAFEEPETSQHPENQEMLVKAFLDLADQDNCQVILTTHNPALAGLIQVEKLRFITKNDQRECEVRLGNGDVYSDIAKTLGVLPDPDKDKVKLLLCVEGSNDIAFLKGINKILCQNDPSIIDFTKDKRIAFLPLGGSNLKDWVFNHHLKGLKLPEVHIFDLDDQVKPPYKDACQAVNQRGDGSWATLTSKKEMENYIHPEAIKEAIHISMNYGDYDDVPALAASIVHDTSPDISKPWIDLPEKTQKEKIKNIKRRLNKDAIEKMTLDRINHIDKDGEILLWFKEIQKRLN